MKVVKWIHPNELDEQRKVHYCGLGCSYINKYIEADYDENYEDAIIKELGL